MLIQLSSSHPGTICQRVTLKYWKPNFSAGLQPLVHIRNNRASAENWVNKVLSLEQKNSVNCVLVSKETFSIFQICIFFFFSGIVFICERSLGLVWRGDLANPQAMYCNVADLSFWSQLIPAGPTNKQENLYNTLGRKSTHERMRFSFHNFGKRNGILHLFNTGQSFTPLPNYKKIILSSVHCRETSRTPQQNIPSDLSESVFPNFHDKNIFFCNCVKQVKNKLVHIRLCTYMYIV